MVDEGELILALADALTSVMGESEWKRFGIAQKYSTEIENHPRFLRSLSWGDSDYGGHVLDLVRMMFEREETEAIEYLVGLPAVESWLKRNRPAELAELQPKENDPLLDAISGGLEEVHQLASAISLGQYTTRIRGALGSDPSLALGGTKELVEAVMRTILERHGFGDVEKLDFAPLASACFNELALSKSDQPANKVEGEAGTGHGKASGKAIPIDQSDAEMIAAGGMILAAWLMRRDPLG